MKLIRILMIYDLGLPDMGRKLWQKALGFSEVICALIFKKKSIFLFFNEEKLFHSF